MQGSSGIIQFIEGLHGFLASASTGVGAAVLIGLVLFSHGFKSRSIGDRDKEHSHSVIAEYAWGVVPFVLFVLIFYWGLK